MGEQPFYYHNGLVSGWSHGSFRISCYHFIDSLIKFKLMKFLRYFGFIAIAIFLLAAGCNNFSVSENTNKLENIVDPLGDGAPSNVDKEEQAIPDEIVAPISRAKERVTKKPFGIFIDPKTSPVQPEQFKGYHSGTDFETFSEEQGSDVIISAICTGKLATKRIVTGFGGLVTQYCTIDSLSVTIIYGHVRLSSVTTKVGEELKAGDKLGVLGTGFSAETSNERKHLHLGIAKGQGSDIRGYVQQQSLLTDFLDIMKYL